jgi:hypothetical protein
VRTTSIVSFPPTNMNTFIFPLPIVSWIELLPL